MLDDIRFSLNYLELRKTEMLIRYLQAEGFVCWMRLLCHVAAVFPSGGGRMPGYDAEFIALKARWQGDAELFVNSLIKAGCMAFDADAGYSVVDWDLEQTWAADLEDRRAQASLNGVKSGQVRRAKKREAAKKVSGRHSPPLPYGAERDPEDVALARNRAEQKPKHPKIELPVRTPFLALPILTTPCPSLPAAAGTPPTDPQPVGKENQQPARSLKKTASEQPEQQRPEVASQEARAPRNSPAAVAEVVNDLAEHFAAPAPPGPPDPGALWWTQLELGLISAAQTLPGPMRARFIDSIRKNIFPAMKNNPAFCCNGFVRRQAIAGLLYWQDKPDGRDPTGYVIKCVARAFLEKHEAPDDYQRRATRIEEDVEYELKTANAPASSWHGHLAHAVGS